MAQRINDTLRLYEIVFDGGMIYHVEARGFDDAIDVWIGHMLRHHADDGWDGDEEPDEVRLLHGEIEGVIRAPAAH